ncbi:LPS O-antigen length regulator [Vibrio parahaemolyticus]|nr:LPS O-antigen length regulator [Vibrio parahaemolyticus]MBM5034495.1 LPS O-antigen length regulator [Vibrio parahaemolyticus]MBM5047711.1 LPS O-antigen length regulator [Vibrio parahaemolyticus]MBM5076008.1 LPS O-antigen length regulator [Vibrio parahaemolyticus]
MKGLKMREISEMKVDEINLKDLYHIFLKEKWRIIIIGTFIFIGSLIYSLSIPNIYRSDVLLAPNGDEHSTGVNSKFSGLAAMAGVNVGSDSVNRSVVAIEILKSRKFLVRFINENDLKVALFASKEWDKKSRELVIDENIYNEKTHDWVSEPPSDIEAFKYFFNDVLTIQENKENGFYTISINFISPDLSKKWLELLVKTLNDTMKEREIIDSEKNIEYLTEQLNKTSIAEMQSTFFELIGEQTKKLMLAESKSEFAFSTIDPPFIPENKIKPSRVLIIAMITLLGLFIYIALVILFYKNNSQVS